LSLARFNTVALATAGLHAVTALTTWMLLAPRPAEGSRDRPNRLLDALIQAYPEFLDRHEGNELVLKDGTRMAFDDGVAKDFEKLLNEPDVEDMFHWPYPAGRPTTPPPFDTDPGRIRFQPLFDKMYGDCEKGEVEPNLIEVVWLPSKSAQRVKVNRVNGVAERLRAASNELDKLPGEFTVFLEPSEGAYNCRRIAGTNRVSAHGHAIAIDISVAQADYWRWNEPDAEGRYSYRNRIPWDIVEIFEKHGFIWGGRWHHYDTMHFEYRPEILAVR